MSTILGYDRLQTDHGMMYRDRKSGELLVSAPVYSHDMYVDCKIVAEEIGVGAISLHSGYSISYIKRTLLTPSFLGGNLDLEKYRKLIVLLNNVLSTIPMAQLKLRRKEKMLKKFKKTKKN